MHNHRMACAFGLEPKWGVPDLVPMANIEPVLGSVTVKWTFEGEPFPDDPEPMFYQSKTPSGWRFDYPRRLTIELDRTSQEISVTVPEASMRYAQVMVVSHILPLVARLRGEIAIHASAVSLGGSIALVTGPSGAGKSTLTASLTQLGATLVSDDVCVLYRTTTGITVLSGPRESRIWSDMGEALGLETPRLYEGTDKRAIALSEITSFTADPIRWVIELFPDAQAVCKPIRPVATLGAMLTHVRDGDLLELTQKDLDTMADVARTAQGMRVGRPDSVQGPLELAKLVQEALLGTPH